MSDSDLPREISDFISIYINSVGHLEVLLLLSDDPKRGWTAEDVSQELRSNENYANAQLKELTQNGLLYFSENKYYCTKDSDKLSKIYKLRDQYNVRRFSVISLIYNKPLEKIRDLADAFRIKKE